MKPIKTFCNGYEMKSRLEARWACFFTAMGLSWIYEPEGFDTGDLGWYLPDFYLEELKLYVEIKPKLSSYDENEAFKIAWKCLRLSQIAKEPVLLIAGQPYFDKYVCSYLPSDCRKPEEIIRGEFAVGRKCDHLWVVEDTKDNYRGQSLNCKCDYECYPLVRDERLVDAFFKAQNLQWY